MYCKKNKLAQAGLFLQGNLSCLPTYVSYLKEASFSLVLLLRQPYRGIGVALVRAKAAAAVTKHSLLPSPDIDEWFIGSRAKVRP